MEKFSASTEEVDICLAGSRDIDDVCTLLLDEGNNKWNHLPEEDARAHLDGLSNAEKTVEAYVARFHGRIIGVITYGWGTKYAKHQPANRRYIEHGYIAEPVIAKDFVGRGLASSLVAKAMLDLATLGYREVFARRHADNAASQRILEKNGFVPIATYDDPDIRHNGSRQTTLSRAIVASRGEDLATL